MSVSAVSFANNIYSANNISSVGSVQVAKPQATEASLPAASLDSTFSASGAQDDFAVANRSAMLQAAAPDTAEVAMPAETEDTSATAQAAATSAVPGPDASCDEIAAYCNGIAKSDAPIMERVDSITEALTQGVSKAESPDPTWEKATPEQLRLYVHETLEHIDAVRTIGELRGMDFGDHDLEPGVGKFEPKIAQFLAKPGNPRENPEVKWAITSHNASAHHSDWKDPNVSNPDDLAESASDIVNAWRMDRRVYNKAGFSWEFITDLINAKGGYNDFNDVQRTALLQAIPFQMDYEAAQANA